MKIAEAVLLSCLTPAGMPHYDLPAISYGSFSGYDLYWRPFPAPVIHHQKRRRIDLQHQELVFVGCERFHCVSISLDENGIPVEGYVNINEKPLLRRDALAGWSWRDLFLDIKLSRGRIGREQFWTPCLLDWAEFERAQAMNEMTEEQVVVALTEVERLLEKIELSVFPFAKVKVPYLGFAPPQR